MGMRHRIGNRSSGRIAAIRDAVPVGALILMPAFFYALLCLYGFARLLILS